MKKWKKTCIKKLKKSLRTSARLNRDRSFMLLSNMTAIVRRWKLNGWVIAPVSRMPNGWRWTHDWVDTKSHLKHGDVDEGNIAQVARNCSSRISRLKLCKDWPEKSMVDLTDENVRLSAFEEVGHLFLYRLGSCAYSRFISEHEVEEAEHSLIRVLQNVLYPRYK